MYDGISLCALPCAVEQTRQKPILIVELFSRRRNGSLTRNAQLQYLQYGYRLVIARLSARLSALLASPRDRLASTIWGMRGSSPCGIRLVLKSPVESLASHSACLPGREPLDPGFRPPSATTGLKQHKL